LKCGCVSSPTGGTSNYWQHLYHHHRTVWLEYKAEDGELTDVGTQELDNIRSGMRSRMHASDTCTKRPPLPPKARVALDRLLAEWIVDDDQFANAASKPGLKKVLGAISDGAYEGVGVLTIKGHVSKLAVEGKAKATTLHKIVENNGLKIVISADLWSKNGVALLGILSHAIIETTNEKGDLVWSMVEVLSGAIPCKKDRHTGEYVEIATFEQLSKLGIAKPVESIFKAKSDRGSNMLKGYEKLSQDPCADHLIDTSVKSYFDHEAVSPTLRKGRATVGSFNSSTIGKSDLGECQTAVGIKIKTLVQDVVTRWASTFAMTNSFRENMDALLLYAVKKLDVASDSFKANCYSMEEWQVNNQTCAVLGGLAAASNVLEGKSYPTSNMIIPYLYGCISSLHFDAPTIQMWDGTSIAATDLHPSVRKAREALHQSLMGFWVTDIDHNRLMFLLICTLLDPRLLELRLPLISPTLKSEAKEAFLAEYSMNWAPLKAPLKKDVGDGPSTEGEVEGDSSEGAPKESEGDSNEGSSGKVKQVAMGSFSDFMFAMETHGILPQPEVEVEDKVEVGEAELYLTMSPAPQGTDVLQWWASNKPRFPNLARMAQQFLAVPATSASAERVFSLAGRVFGDLTQNQNDTTLEERMWAKINRKQVLE